MLPTNSSTSSLVRQASTISLSEQNQSGSESYFDSQSNDPRRVLAEVADWLHKEKSRARRHKALHHHSKDFGHTEAPSTERSQHDHEPAMDLEKLERIMSGYMKSTTPKGSSRSPMVAPRSPGLAPPSRKNSIASKFKRNSVVNLSSDTEFFGDEVLVPGVEAYLDNSRTLAYSGGEEQAETTSVRGKETEECWVTFKEDILRLTHTLKLKGWRRVPMENAAGIEVARLSGALTNAVYVVKPPKPAEIDGEGGIAKGPKPKFLLLRIYGPQSDHLIDRAVELSILRRLAQKKIGPRLLGTFSNGRFEEYLHSVTLEAEDLRVPETSKQIAKRMRELHDGIELLNSEIDAGPSIFILFDKYLDRCEKVIAYLDRQVNLSLQPSKPDQEPPQAKYTRYGLVCGTEWPVFRRTYDKYRARLVKEVGGNSGLRKKLVFAHNDTQYGNLMRLKPSGESPLLQPSNHHKQLVVIDFEYAGQNTAGLEFANHFSEWCYNYHHPEVPWACHTQAYPTEEEQRRFIRSYIMHRPQFNSNASSTPNVLQGRERTNIPDFMLDARAPPGSESPAQGNDYDAEESAREKKLEDDIKQLLYETRLWRMANSAHWVAWGIVQAKVPELDKASRKHRAGTKAKEVLGRVVEGVKSGLSGRRGSRSAAHPGGQRKVIADPNAEDKAAAEGTVEVPSEALTESNGSATAPSDPWTASKNIYGDKTPAAISDGEVVTDSEAEPDVNAKAAEAGTMGEEEEEFDYLAYAQDRAMFFWGDALQMGLVTEEELPEAMRQKVKRVPY
ncbi:Choline kinase [Cyphellophora attinorum]|uniref:Choline kinase n=1 Tax=Cyphellophora attinorum TaxID=1664694 RepID=A0A0N1H5S5_9EURO|nr:Choline kinase [Phialophora attinorum]KPI41193.1 Choline kinase [Phialophora attinorum]